MKYPLFLITLVLLAAPAFAQDTAAKKPTEAQRLEALIGPWVGESTVGVVHINLKTLRLQQMFDDAYAVAKRYLKRTLTEENEVLDAVRIAESTVKSVEAELQKIRDAGTGDVFILVDMKLGGPQSPMLVIPVYAKQKPDEVQAVLDIPKNADWLPEEAREAFQQGVLLHREGNYILATIATDEDDAEIKAEILKTARKAITAAKRVELAAGLKATAKYPIKGLFMPNDELWAMAPALIENLQEEDAFPGDFTLPDAKTLRRMMRVCALGADPRLDKYSSHILSSNEQAAVEYMELLVQLQELTLEKLEAEAGDPLQAAIMADMADMYFKAFMPKRNGAHIFWDKDVMVEEFSGDAASLKAVAVTGVLTALVLPAVQSARGAAQRMQGNNNMKQVILAMVTHDAIHGKFPPAYTVDKAGKPLHSWRVTLLPYMDQTALYGKIRHDEPWDSEWNRQFHNANVPFYASPQVNAGPGMATIAVVVGDETAFPPGGKAMDEEDIHDGMSFTIALVERAPVCWMDPAGDVLFEDACKGIDEGGENGLVAYSPAGMCVAFLDGAVQTISDMVDPEMLKAILTRAGGEHMNTGDLE